MRTDARAGWVRAGPLALGLLLGGCGEAEPEAPLASGPPPPTIYRHSEDHAPGSLDPAQAGSQAAVLVVRAVYDTLYRYRYLARPYQLAPGLAEDLPEVSADGRIYRIRLREDARFPDDPRLPGGRPVEAADVVASLLRHYDPASRSQGGWLWLDRIEGLRAWVEAGRPAEGPSGLRALEASVLEIRLAAPYPALPHTLASAFAAVIPRELAVGDHGLARQPLGSGPFRLLQSGSTQLRLGRNPDYRRERLDLAAEGYQPTRHAAYGLEALDGRRLPLVDEVWIDWVADPASRWLSYSKGDEIQYTVAPPEQLDRLLDSRDPPRLKPAETLRSRFQASLEAGLIHARFQFDHPQLGAGRDAAEAARNRALRCAIRDSVDWAERNRRFHGGLAQIFGGVITPLMAEFQPRLLPAPPPGLDRRLRAAGWTAETLPVLTEALAGGTVYRERHEHFADGLQRALGWPRERIRQQVYGRFADLDAAIRRGEADFYWIGWSLDYPDAENTLALFYGPNAAPGANSGNYRDAGFDRGYETLLSLPPGPERAALAQRLNQLLIDDCAVVAGLSRARVELWHRRVLALPDRDFGQGFWLRFVAVEPAPP
ncbi:MAG TPA: ABC transporter substrate-binding protein [Nevskiaceae bacterium]|nr:ABC transporter substrate-binding protein [Nevskiaceae bacterium]